MDPVIVEGGQRPAVGDEARVVGGVGYEESVGAMVWIQVSTGGVYWFSQLVGTEVEYCEVGELGGIWWCTGQLVGAEI